MSDWHHVRDTRQKARKAYPCYLCGEPIEKGREYVRRFGYVGEGPVSQCMHPECELDSRDWEAGDWETFYPGDAERPRQ